MPKDQLLRLYRHSHLLVSPPLLETILSNAEMYLKIQMITYLPMDQCTHEVRAEYWKRIIQACGQRPAGQSAKSWMEENGICEQSYYHWQRKFRQQAYGQMKASAPMNLSEVTVPAEAETTDISFVELPCCPAAEKDAQMDAPAAVIRTSALTIEITNRISDALLHRILQEAAHA